MPAATMDEKEIHLIELTSICISILRRENDYCTINLIAHTAKIVAKILRRRIEKKIEDVHGEDQFGFRREKGTRNATGMLRIISERTLEIDEELSVCFIDWQKAFDQVNWTK
jgi:predicted DNA-binding protein